ncbi:hypothetical protein ES703_93550 [subsurface metagenome]
MFLLFVSRKPFVDTIFGPIHKLYSIKRSVLAIIGRRRTTVLGIFGILVLVSRVIRLGTSFVVQPKKSLIFVLFAAVLLITPLNTMVRFLISSTVA